ncbi:MAG: YitT family protein, partial [Ramlibacter sp.]
MSPPTAITSPDADLEDLARHRPHEDLQALVTGTLFVALGVVMFKEAGLLTGGTVGVALLVHYASGLDFAPAYFLVNLPFYVLAWMRMG